MEMTDVAPDERITIYYLGLWSDEQISDFARIIKSDRQYGAKIGIQLVQAGRKAEEVETSVAPLAFRYPGTLYKEPRELTINEIHEMVQVFGSAAHRQLRLG
jgi:NADPH2 dehydrogenase